MVHASFCNRRQGVTWLSYTYLHVRMRRNPMAYGVPLSDREADPQLLERRRQLITQAAETLDDHKVGRIDDDDGGGGDGNGDDGDNDSGDGSGRGDGCSLW